MAVLNLVKSHSVHGLWSRLVNPSDKSKKTHFLMCFASTYRCYMPAVRFSRHFNSMSSELMVGFLDERKLTTTWADFVHWIGGVGNSRRSTTGMPGSGKSIAFKLSGTSISIGCKALERATWNGYDLYEAALQQFFFEQQIMSRSQLKASCLSYCSCFIVSHWSTFYPRGHPTPSVMNITTTIWFWSHMHCICMQYLEDRWYMCNYWWYFYQ